MIVVGTSKSGSVRYFLIVPLPYFFESRTTAILLSRFCTT